MDVDARHDHSLRVPRPDLSLQLDTPNACTGCHLKSENVDVAKRPKLKLYQDWMAAARGGDAEVKAELQRANTWCNEACEKWYGPNRKRDEHFGQAIAAGQRRTSDAVEQLNRLLRKPKSEVPPIARATALQTLNEVDSTSAGELAIELIKDPHPLVRAAACDAMLGANQLAPGLDALGQALADPIRLVRTAAARSLLQVPTEQHPSSIAPKLNVVSQELMSGMLYDADRAGAT